MKVRWGMVFKKPINMVCFVVISALMLVLFFYVHTNQYTTFEDQNRSDSMQLDGLLLSFETVSSKDGSPLYQNLLLQKSEVAKQLNGILFNQPEKYKESSLALSELRLQAQKEETFNSEAKALQPTLMSTLKNQTYFDYLNQSKEDFILKPESFGSLMLLFFSLLGLIWFPICAILTANILEDEFEHPSLTMGQPTTFINRLTRKALRLYVILLISLIISLSIGFFVTYFFGNPINDFSYHNVIYLSEFVLLKNWQIILLNILYLTIIFFFTFILSAFLNGLIRNFYLTLILELLLVTFPVIIPELMSHFPFYIGGFLLPTNLFNGNYLNDSTNLFLTPFFGMLYLIICSLILVLLTSYISKKGLKGVRG